MVRGGKRKGAGRPTGSGKYGKDTKVIRVPFDMITEIEQFVATEGYALPFYSDPVQAGNPAPIFDDNTAESLNLMSHLVQNPKQTFIVKANGDSMIDAGIHSGDLLIVDKSLKARVGDIVIASLDNYFTVKRLALIKGKGYLMPENKKYDPIPLEDRDDLQIWGVVIHCVHNLKS